MFQIKSRILPMLTALIIFKLYLTMHTKFSRLSTLLYDYVQAHLFGTESFVYTACIALQSKIDTKCVLTIPCLHFSWNINLQDSGSSLISRFSTCLSMWAGDLKVLSADFMDILHFNPSLSSVE